MTDKINSTEKLKISFADFKNEVLNDYQLATISREVSLLGRKEVLTGKAKFGIFGDGKELPQIALAKYFRHGDWRSGYYRDQTFMFAIEASDVEKFFAQLYANPDAVLEPASAGRQMNAHYATRFFNEQGQPLSQVQIKNSAADSSPTASQMARALGLAFASKVYRNYATENSVLYSNQGNEVCIATIGDASTSEGVFWETVNAAGVLKIPLVINVWDDGYGISVPKKYQTTKGNISEVLKGFKRNQKNEGIEIFTVNGWDYVQLCEVYAQAMKIAREDHIPVLVHVKELTQPQGHSTSGSHERYKSAKRLEWEKEYDCNVQFRKWILATSIATEQELNAIEQHAKSQVKAAKNNAWQNFIQPIKDQIERVVEIFTALAEESEHSSEIRAVIYELQHIIDPFRKDVLSCIKKVGFITRFENLSAKNELVNYKQILEAEALDKFSSHQQSESSNAALQVLPVNAQYEDDAPLLNGYEILNHYFDVIFQNNSQLIAFGEDLGKIGDVNQGFAGLQAKHGQHRIFDVGIREATIIGQGIGMAMRGLRPIAEIQYLDYLIYGLQPLCDDLATLSYRTKGGQKAPLIIRTRGHRLEGIWHTGSPISMILGALRGIYVCVPRNMTQAVGMYNTLLQSDEPGLVIECLNGYRLKEKLPSNLAEFTVPFGQPEVLQAGEDITIVTYGSCIRIALQAIEKLAVAGISCELIDVQTLLPFDLNHKIVESIKKTNRVLFLDEDVPGGGTAFMFQQVMEIQQAYFYLDSPAKTLSAKEHRTAYASDGDYFCKPNADDVFAAVYSLMNEVNPNQFPQYF